METYRIYCSTCNKEKKSKMSWSRYLRYLAIDGKSKGYQEIDSDLVKNAPTKCIFGHAINTSRTVIIKK